MFTNKEIHYVEQLISHQSTRKGRSEIRTLISKLKDLQQCTLQKQNYDYNLISRQ